MTAVPSPHQAFLLIIAALALRSPELESETCHMV